MKFICDHDLHIHSRLSPCSHSDEQTADKILEICSANGMKLICLTDHFWDSTVKTGEFNNGWRKNDYKDNSVWLPLPQKDGIKFLFGCEADMNMHDDIGITEEVAALHDFIIIPTNHLHMKGFTASPDLITMEDYRKSYMKRLQILLDSKLPHKKMGIAHLTCSLAYKDDHRTFFNTMEDAFWHDSFAQAAEEGFGVELNFSPFGYSEEDLEKGILRPYRIAKEHGCKFYCGSDAHTPGGFENFVKNMNAIVDLLGLTEDDKYHITGYENY